MRVLFSPIGTTDPVRDSFDGPMLHIARHYKPDSIWLFLSTEMIKKDKLDNRYEKSIRKVLPECDVRKLKHPEITNPADFDAYLKLFPEIIEDIKAEYNEVEIIANVSSGTTQMKASVCLEVLNESILIRPVQVLTPSNKSNIDVKYTNDFSDFESIWDNNLDNLSEAENRCIEPPILSFKLTKIKAQITSLIENYEYKAALELAKLYKEHFSDELLKLLNHAALRIGFHFREGEEYIGKDNKELYPIIISPKYDLYEALCIMKVLQLKGEINNLMVKISPFLAKLAEEYITEVLKYNSFSHLFDLYRKNKLVLNKYRLKPSEYKECRKKLSRKKIESIDNALLGYLDDQYRPQFKDSDIGFDNLVKIIEYNIYNMENKTSEKYEKLSKDLIDFQDMVIVEKELRHPLAHKLEAFDDDDIRLICNDQERIKNKIRNAKDIVNIMERLFKNTYGDTVSKAGFIYSIINEKILICL